MDKEYAGRREPKKNSHKNILRALLFLLSYYSHTIVCDKKEKGKTV